MLNNIDRKEFEEKVKPLIKYLNEFHPHIKLIITNNNAEILEGVISTKTDEFIKD